MFVTASDKKCSLRVLSTGKHHLKIKSTLDDKYKIFSVLLSSRGYLVICSRAYIKSERSYTKDVIEVFSINGEKIIQRATEGNLNALLFDETGYYLTAGDTSGKLYVYELITMEYVDYGMAGTSTIFPSSILSLSLFPGTHSYLK